MTNVTAPPRLGIRLHGGIAPCRCVELAQAAESAEFWSAWFAENPFDRGVMPAAAACAAATSRLRIGIGVFNPYNRHPTLIAMEIGALDELADGRAALGIGSGIGGAVERMGLSYDRPIAAVRDAFAIIRPLLRGETATHDGPVFSAKDVKLGYPPPRPNLPLFMAARGDQSLRLCGRIADGLMISNMCPRGFTEYAVEEMGDAARAAGREAPSEIIQYVPCVIGSDHDAAVRSAKEALGAMLPGFWSLGIRFPAAKAAMLRGVIDEAEFTDAVGRLTDGEPAVQALNDRFVDQFAVAGTAEECLAKSADYAKAGVTELVFTIAGPNPQVGMAALGALLKS